MIRKFFRIPEGKISVALLALGLLVILLARFFPSPQTQEAGLALAGPSAGHWFGHDSLGRDLFARVLEGARLSFAIGFFSAMVALVCGLLIGSAAGLAPRRLDALLMRAADIYYSLPTFLVAALLLLFFGRGPTAVILALGLTNWVGEARLVRVLVRQIKAMPYVEGAEALGLSKLAILKRHILPNILGPVMVSVASGVPAIILTESFLSFVGLGLEAPYASLGTLAAEGWRAFRTFPHLILFPGAALFLLVFLFTLAGDAGRDALDPMNRG